MSLRYAAFLFLTFVLTMLMAWGTYNTARLLRTWTPDRNLLLMPGENLIRLSIIGACVGLGLLSGLPPETLGWTVADFDRQLLWGIGWGVVLAGLFYITTQWLTESSGERFYSHAVIQYIVPKSDAELVLVTLAMVPVVVLEELLFRSLLLGGLSPLAPPLVLAVAVGVLFGILHSPQGVWGMIGAGVAGVLFGLLFFQAGSIVLPLVAHYVTNMLQIGLTMRHRPYN